MNITCHCFVYMVWLVPGARYSDMLFASAMKSISLDHELYTLYWIIIFKSYYPYSYAWLLGIIWSTLLQMESKLYYLENSLKWRLSYYNIYTLRKLAIHFGFVTSLNNCSCLYTAHRVHLVSSISFNKHHCSLGRKVQTPIRWVNQPHLPIWYICKWLAAHGN